MSWYRAHLCFPLSRSHFFPVRLHLPAVKYSREPFRCSLAVSWEAYTPTGNNENGCILTTHTLIVNPVNVADRAGASPVLRDHPLIRSFASLQPLRATYTHMYYERVASKLAPQCSSHPSLCLSLSFSIPICSFLFPSLALWPLTPVLLRRASAYAQTRTMTSTIRIIHAISRVYRSALKHLPSSLLQFKLNFSRMIKNVDSLQVLSD